MSIIDQERIKVATEQSENAKVRIGMAFKAATENYTETAREIAAHHGKLVLSVGNIEERQHDNNLHGLLSTRDHFSRACYLSNEEVLQHQDFIAFQTLVNLDGYDIVNLFLNIDTVEDSPYPNHDTLKITMDVVPYSA